VAELPSPPAKKKAGKKGKKRSVKRSPAKPAVARRKSAGKRADADGIVKAIRKRLGKKSESAVAVLGQEDVLSEVTEWIPSGFPDLDRVIGGGWAVGRASEVYGDEGCGKTALGYEALRECQALGGLAVLLDFERALDEKKMRGRGIDPDQLVYVAPDSAEEGWETVWAIVEQLKSSPPDAPTFILWDSIAAAVPADVRDGKMGDSHIGLHARIMTQGCMRMFVEISKVRAHMMWINQNRSKIGGFSGWGGPQTDTTGGRAVKFAASQRVANKVVKRVRRKQGTDPTGYIIKTTTDKCRLAPPHRSTEWILDFRLGPSPELSARHLLTEAGMLKKGKGPGMVKGPWSSKPFRRAEWLQHMSDPGFRAGVHAAIGELMAAGGARQYRETKAGTSDDDDEEGEE
jgi:recombination protein RecA